jgi:hypothetical protein
LTKLDELRVEDFCCEAQTNWEIKLNNCTNNREQKWYHTRKGIIMSLASNKCIHLNNRGKLVLQNCNTTFLNQQWLFSSYF